jgi:hypothetical protein
MDDPQPSVRGGPRRAPVAAFQQDPIERLWQAAKPAIYASRRRGEGPVRQQPRHRQRDEERQHDVLNPHPEWPPRQPSVSRGSYYYLFDELGRIVGMVTPYGQEVTKHGPDSNPTYLAIADGTPFRYTGVGRLLVGWRFGPLPADGLPAGIDLLHPGGGNCRFPALISVSVSQPKLAPAGVQSPCP